MFELSALVVKFHQKSRKFKQYVFGQTCFRTSVVDPLVNLCRAVHNLALGFELQIFRTWDTRFSNRSAIASGFRVYLFFLSYIFIFSLYSSIIVYLFHLQKCSYIFRCLYCILRDIIPSCRKRVTSDIDVIFSAIDYIRELHLKLEETGIIFQFVTDRPPLSPIEENTSGKVRKNRMEHIADYFLYSY